MLTLMKAETKDAIAKELSTRCKLDESQAVRYTNTVIKLIANHGYTIVRNDKNASK